MGKVTTAACKAKLVRELKAEAGVRKTLADFCEDWLGGAPTQAEIEDIGRWKRTTKRRNADREWVRDFALRSDELGGGSDEDFLVLARVWSDPDDTKIVRMAVGGVWDPTDFYFVVEEYDGDWVATITRRDHFDRTGYVSDQSEADQVLPDGFYRLSESSYEFEMPPDDARAVLTAAGFVHKPDLLAKFGA